MINEWKYLVNLGNNRLSACPEYMAFDFVLGIPVGKKAELQGLERPPLYHGFL